MLTALYLNISFYIDIRMYFGVLFKDISDKYF